MALHQDLRLLANGSRPVDLNEYDTTYTAGLDNREQARKRRKLNIKALRKLQEKLYAHNQYAVLIIFQAMDAAGKDSTIKHVMSGINPQGCQVFSFKHPSANELDHDYMWRCYKSMPERGRIGIFNRSYYEEVLITKVHPEIILGNRLPHINRLEDMDTAFWESRYQQINQFEQHLHQNGTVIIKFFLHLSYEEQARRFLARIRDPEKHWKFSSHDLEERKHWKAYQQAYEDCINKTGTSTAPWYIIPADHKWAMRTIVSEIILERIGQLKPQFPTLPEEEQALLGKAEAALMGEVGG